MPHPQVLQLAQLLQAMQQQAAAAEASSTTALASIAQQLRAVATQQEQLQQQHQALLEGLESRCAGGAGCAVGVLGHHNSVQRGTSRLQHSTQVWGCGDGAPQTLLMAMQQLQV